MADQKMIFLPIASTSRFVTKKNIIDSESGNMRGGIRKSCENESICSAEILKSNLWNFNDAFNLVNIIVVALPVNHAAFKNDNPSTDYVVHIDKMTIYDAECMDLVMPIYNLMGNIFHYADTWRSLWCYSKDE